MARKIVLAGTILRELFERIPVPGEKLDRSVRRCTKCGAVKPIAAFGRNSNAPSGLQTRCKDCTNENARRERRERLQGEPEYAYHLALAARLRTYGLTRDQFERMMLDQGGRCATCPRLLTGVGKDTHVDHCHETGRVRSLLCSPCNRAVGLIERFGLSGATLDEYINKHRPAADEKAT